MCVQAYQSTDRVEKVLSADEVIRFTKPITVATAKAIAAGNSGRQEDVIIAANLGRKAISDLLRACKVLQLHCFVMNSVNIYERKVDKCRSMLEF